MSVWTHVPCPACGAVVAEPCRSYSGRNTSPHSARRRDWWAKAREWRNGQ